MPSLQSALPPELSNNSIRLYRECLRRAKYIGSKQNNTEFLTNMVRQQFKRSMHEKDPEKIQKLMNDAARGLLNHMLYEAVRLSVRYISKTDKIIWAVEQFQHCFDEDNDLKGNADILSFICT